MKNYEFNLDKIKSCKKGLALSLALIMSTSLIGCRNVDYDDYSLNTVVESLHEKDELTGIDDFVLEEYVYNGEEMTLEELDDMFIEAYKQEDALECNAILNAISKRIIKAQIAEGYDIDYDKIKDLNVIGHLGKEYNPDNGKFHSVTEYGVTFKSDGENYQIEAKNKMARNLCIIYRASMKDQLSFDYEGHDILVLRNAYDTLKQVMASSLEFENKEHRRRYDDEATNGKGYKYDGFFDLKTDKEKEKAIDHYTKGKVKIKL